MGVVALGCRDPHRDTHPDAPAGSAASANAARVPDDDGADRGPVATPDPTTLVVVHSWSGRTERLGHEMARMLGARFVAYHDPPMPDAGSRPPSLDEVLPDLSLAGVRTLFLGFPVWGQSPSPAVQRFVSTARLDGVRVVPFFSFVHWIKPDALESLMAAVRGRGGEVAPEMPFLIHLAVSEKDLDVRAETALLARRDLWSAGPEEERKASCTARKDGDGADVCRVPAGIAWVGDGAPDAPPGAVPPRRVRVGAFDIQRTEVTVARYERCVAAGACAAIDYNENFCKVLLKEPGDRDALPVPCATYTNADAYCRWAGMRLPTEAEWIRAGRGDTTRAFPWGDAFAGLHGNFGEKPSTGFPGYSNVPEDRAWTPDGHRGLAPPCSFPDGHSPFGVCDLAGNLAEWIANEGGPTDIAKGGSWMDGEPSAYRLGARGSFPSVFSRKMGIYLTGIRCARGAS
jgi:formylglycine-generating enzyme required for sulfatase activity